MGLLSELRRWALEQAREGMTEPELAEQLFARLLDEPDLLRASGREWALRVAGDAVAGAVKPSGRSQRAPAPIYEGQLRLALADMAPLDGLAADRAYVTRMAPVAARHAAAVARLRVMEPFASRNNLAQWATYADACRAAGMNDENVSALAS